MHKNLFVTLLVSTLIYGCSPVKPNQDSAQQLLNQIAESLEIRYTVIENKGNGGCISGIHKPCHRANIKLTSPIAIKHDNWNIYFSSVDKISSVNEGEFSIHHINGDLHRLAPTHRYKAFTAGETKTIEFTVNGLALTEARLMPNYYIAADGLRAQTIDSSRTSTDVETDLETLPYLSDVDWQENFTWPNNDNTQLATPAYLFDKNKDVQKWPHAFDIGVIPTPQNVTRNKLSPELNLADGIFIKHLDVNEQTISFALSRLEMLGLKRSPKGIPASVYIQPDKFTRHGSYSLDTTNSEITIIAADGTGASHALISLAALITYGKQTIPAVHIKDEPRYQFRGMHVDVARNFQSKQLLISLMDQMAAYKLNKLHLHLADDEGWRLEISGLPELTDIGSKRCHDLTESACLLPQLGSGASPHNTRDGFYSKSDYIDILRAASDRHIQVIPSIDTPGHSRAAIKSMQARHRFYLSKNDVEAAQKYLLTDINDKTEYSSIQRYNDNTINVCMESSYHFIEKVIDEIQAIHAEAKHPLTRFHIGADETAGAWLDSPACDTLLENDKSPISSADDLGGYFIERIAQMLDRKNIETAGWSDGMSHPSIKKMPNKVQSNIWSRLYRNGHKVAHSQLNKGWEVVISSPDVLYFDFPYEADPKEHGYNWASRHTNTRKVFEFMPDNLPIHAEFWRDVKNNHYQADDRLIKDSDGVILQAPIEQGKMLTGIQGHIWSETIRSEKQVEYQVFPRLLSLAERAWHMAPWEVPYDYRGALYNKDTNVFTNTLKAQRELDWARFSYILGKKELRKLDQANIAYRIPTVGAKIEDGILTANLILPGLTIQYLETGDAWKTYKAPTTVTGDVQIRALSSDEKRIGRSLRVPFSQ